MKQYFIILEKHFQVPVHKIRWVFIKNIDLKDTP